jgi:hypothetical protein
MACPQVADGGDGLHIFRVAVNMSQTANKRWFCSLGFSKGLTTPLHKSNLLQSVTQGLGLGWIPWNDLGSGKWI